MQHLSLLLRPLCCRLRLQGLEAGIRRVRQADDRNTAREGQMRRTGRQTRLCMPPAMLSVIPTESTVDDANCGNPHWQRHAHHAALAHCVAG